MNRDRYKTVTNKESFAILIPTSREDAMGEATFLPESIPGLVSPVPVRPVTLKELKTTGKQLRGLDAKQFDALLMLRRALEARDKLEMAEAKERMEQVYELRDREEAEYWKAPEYEETRRCVAELTESSRPGSKGKRNAYRLLSFEISRVVGGLNTQIVLWWAERMGRFIPAIFCNDMQTALYLHSFFIAPTGEPGFRICPKCKDQFFQDRSNQDYCCPAHREAHRVARFRDNKKRNAEREKDGRKHGTQKTR